MVAWCVVTVLGNLNLGRAVVFITCNGVGHRSPIAVGEHCVTVDSEMRGDEDVVDAAVGLGIGVEGDVGAVFGKPQTGTGVAVFQ